MLDSITFKISPGETGIIAGPNGSGKSTLLKIAAGLLTPQVGVAELLMNGRPVTDAERRAQIGYLSPDLTLYRELTGAENLAFFAELRGIIPSREMLVDALTEVGLRGRGRDLVSGYSSGMRQRLKYAFALLGRPQVLLLDEPTANLDMEGAEMVKRIVGAQLSHEEGGMVLIATNDSEEAAWGRTVATLGAAA